MVQKLASRLPGYRRPSWAQGRRRALPLLATALALAATAAGCGGEPKPALTPGNVETGIASYYASKFHGRSTASGEIYDETALTAAHRTLPFGTIARVTNLENGNQVEVRINDRGPFQDGRIVDVSRQAAEVLGMLRAGLVRVRLEVLRSP